MSIGQTIVTRLCRVGAFFSAAVGNSPEEIAARKALGIHDPARREEIELGMPQERPEKKFTRHSKPS